MKSWHPTSEELKVRMFINYKLFGMFLKPVAETIIKGMVGVKEVDFSNEHGENYCFVSVSDSE